jgi:hypothetical protein
MKDKIKNHAQISLVILLTILAIVSSVWLTNRNQQKIEGALRGILDDKYALLTELSEITDRNGADETITRIVADCSKRTEFESLLVRLAELDRKDLLVLQNLSDACVGFYSERKALMVSRLEDEFDQYSEFVTLLSVLTTNDLEKYGLQKWDELIMLEGIRSSLLTEQKEIQERIISELILGTPVNGAVIKAMSKDAEEIAEVLGIHDKKIDTIRESLAKSGK